MPLKLLDKKRLIAEHYNVHEIFKSIQQGKNKDDPEVQRFQNHLGQLVDRHNAQIDEMFRRGVNHKSPLEGIENMKFKAEPYTYSILEMEYDLEILEKRQKGLG
jgi:hypothetical protein